MDQNNGSEAFSSVFQNAGWLAETMISDALFLRTALVDCDALSASVSY